MGQQKIIKDLISKSYDLEFNWSWPLMLSEDLLPMKEMLSFVRNIIRGVYWRVTLCPPQEDIRRIQLSMNHNRGNWSPCSADPSEKHTLKAKRQSPDTPSSTSNWVQTDPCRWLSSDEGLAWDLPVTDIPSSECWNDSLSLCTVHNIRRQCSIGGHNYLCSFMFLIGSGSGWYSTKSLSWLDT